jgi:hypothetical protein
MLHKCANPACSTLFRRITEGKLFLVQMHPQDSPRLKSDRPIYKRTVLRRVEHYWLCDECSRHLTLVVEPEGMATVPLPQAMLKKPVAAEVCPAETTGWARRRMERA